MVQKTVVQFFSAAEVQVDEDAFSKSERAVLNAVNGKVAASESLENVMNFLFEATQESCAFDRLGLAFHEQDSGRMVSYWNRAVYENLLLDKGYSRPLRGSSLAEVIESGRTRLINDLGVYLQQKPDSESTRMLVREGIRSSMTCPLVVEGRNVGVLFRSATRPYAFGTHQLALHLAISQQLSQAVEKAYRIEQLTAANKAYAEMLGFVSHELKGPVAAMVMQARLLGDGFVGELTRAQNEKLERIVNKGEYLLKLIRDYLDLARLEGGELQFRPNPAVDLHETVLDPALDALRESMEEREITLDKEISAGDAKVECDGDLMRIVVQNLLSNAIKYSHPGGRVKLTVEKRPDCVCIEVWNEGPGFSAKEKGRLFRKFSRLSKPELIRRRGTGVGLYTVAKIVGMHGGRIEADSEEGHWAEFTVTVPQPLAPEGTPSKAYFPKK
jgi:hypothetical protein